MSRLIMPSILGMGDVYAPVHGNTFTWNGYEYTVIVKNGLAWLDRNLGASRVATALNDSDAYGFLFQWGRYSDGHEDRGSGTTTIQSTTERVGHDDFIITVLDWLTPLNNNLWDGVNAVNNPSPPGWRLPTNAEMTTEKNSWSSQNSAGAFDSSLKWPCAGYRDRANGIIGLEGSRGYVWTGQSWGNDNGSRLMFRETSSELLYFSKAMGASVRLVRDIV